MLFCGVLICQRIFYLTRDTSRQLKELEHRRITFCISKVLCDSVHVHVWMVSKLPSSLIYIYLCWSCNRTGESRGFAFVRYKYAEEAQKAVDRLDGTSPTFLFLKLYFAYTGNLFLHGVLNLFVCFDCILLLLNMFGDTYVNKCVTVWFFWQEEWSMDGKWLFNLPNMGQMQNECE